VSRVVFTEDVLDPAFQLILENMDGAVVFTAEDGGRRSLGLFRAGEEVTARIAFHNWLAPDRYQVTPGVADNGGMRVIDRPMRWHTITVTGARMNAGLIELPFDVTLERRAAAPEERVT
jgi:hypothetical protein